MSIFFSPTSLGPQSAALEVVPDSTGSPPQSVPITGTGLVDNVINLTVPNSVVAGIVGGDATTGTVQLLGTAPADTTVDLSSSSPAASVPATVVVPAGSSTATFPITTSPVWAPTPVSIYAITAGDPDPSADVVEENFEVEPPAPPVT